MKNFSAWLNNVPIKKKFVPLQIIIILCVILISSFSFFSVVAVNTSSENIIDDNVRNKELLSEITRGMYVCRVLGRDILLQEDEVKRLELYEEYIIAFDELDYAMDEFSLLLSGSQLTEFKRIIQEKNAYKESMILSADIWIGGGEYADALYALQVVTPIANDFFGSIDTFSQEEERLLNVALEHNDNLVLNILIFGVIINLIVIVAVSLFIRFFSNNMSFSLETLEASMTKIAETGNMKIEIPKELYTKDEVGRIASVSNNMKTMLLEYSFNDPLTGGLNTKAYHEELNDIFFDNTQEKELWCVISDMNNLKQINDILGHMEGDNAIRKSYYCLNKNFKKYGKTFRVGGDEFVSLLSGCSKTEVEETIHTIISEIQQANEKHTHKYSLAFGFDVFVGNNVEEYNNFFKTVDKKMYDNKETSKQSRMNARVHDSLKSDDSFTFI